jgi:hypothetical protein
VPVHEITTTSSQWKHPTTSQLWYGVTQSKIGWIERYNF